jgi:hypothetical protein
MPKRIIAKIAAGERARGHSAKKAESIAYGAANNMGLMHGSKETAKGVRAEAKYNRDHPVKRR